MIREKVVFGPIRSRRLGRSLGINLLPENGKICNFDCIYCECGWNKDGQDDKKIPSRAQVRRALEDKLADLMLDGTRIDNITFSGDGEPTLNPEFPQIIEDTLTLRDAYFPQAKVSVLTNATRLDDPSILEALKKTDSPILKLDAPSDALAAKINKPYPGYRVADVIENMLKFDGDFILQTMFLKATFPDGSTFKSEDFVKEWMNVARYVKPREIMVYTLDRPAPSTGLEAYGEAEMKTLVLPLIEEGYKVRIFGTSKSI